MLPEPSFVEFKYRHADPVVAGWVVWAVFWSLLAILAASLYIMGPPGVVPAIAGAALAMKLWPRRRISLGSRYFVCGDTVAYYKNVRKMALRPGNLTLFWGNRHSFKLEEARFPTNARKAHKISANKAAKFNKVAGKIIDRVMSESPHVELVGIDRTASRGAAQ